MKLLNIVTLLALQWHLAASSLAEVNPASVEAKAGEVEAEPAALEPRAADAAPVLESKAAVAQQCGALGVMQFDVASLPEGTDPNNIRKCAEHPLGVSPNPSSEAANSLSKRTCYWGRRPYGCKNRYCWKRCGAHGQWCWTAWNNGWGKWITCRHDFQCAEQAGAACGSGKCAACGCGC